MNDTVYTLVVEYSDDDVQTYDFHNADAAIEACKHALKHGVKAILLNEYGDVISIKFTD